MASIKFGVSTVNELHDQVWKELGLDHRSITFYVLDIGGPLLVRPGIIDCAGDLYEDDEFFYDASDYGERSITVYSVMSFMLGDGECDHADYDDCEAIEGFMRISDRNTTLMADFLDEYAECLVSLMDFTIDNPAYIDDESESVNE